MAKKRTILIIDDHPLFRAGIKTIIERDSGYEVTEEAGTGRDGLDLARKIKPDLITVDMSLPDMTGIQLTREIASILPDTKVMILSMHSKIDYIAEAFQAGATGYVVKESATDRLLQALKSVLNGDYFLDSAISHKVIEKLMNFPIREARIKDADYGTLTPREQEVMRLIAEGFSSREIAKKLFISPKTAENHRANIMNKLGLHSTLDLIRYAAKLGLIDIDLWKE